MRFGRSALATGLLLALSLATALSLGTSPGAGTRAAFTPIASAQAAEATGFKIPAAPTDWVLDQAGILSPEGKSQLSRLLKAHEDATTEQVVIAVFQSLEGQDLLDTTNRVFQEWHIGQKNKDNGVLLALFWNDRKARIEVGYGLEPLLTDARAKRVLTEALVPRLKAGQTDLALLDSAVEILRAIESPVLKDSPDAAAAQAALKAQRRPGRKVPVNYALVVALGVVILALRALMSAEAHYTARGWHHPSPLDPLRRRRQLEGGFWGSSGGFGGFGGGGGGGGFSGGGGRSGGGGASGGW